MDDRARMLEAHVQFELDRWRGDSATGQFEELVDSLIAWFGQTTAAQLMAPAQVTAWFQRVVREVPPAEAMEVAASTVLDSYRALLAEDDVQLAQVVPRSSYEQFVAGSIGLTEIRQEVIRQVTTNTVYSGLISYVLYHGIKKYLITQNPIARVPGASSLLRLSGKAVRSAAPRLEDGIDKRLVSFIQANVQETVKDSGRFLDGVLDDEMLATLVDEVWSGYAGRPIGDLAGLANETSLGQFVSGSNGIWLALRESPLYGRVIEYVVQGLFDAHGHKTIAELLAESGLTRDLLLSEMAPMAGALTARALDDGFLEQRIRGRLTPFYSSYPVPSD